MIIEPYFISNLTEIKYLYIYKVVACMPFMMFGIYLKEQGQRFLLLNNKSLLMMAFIYIGLTYYNGNTEIWAHNFGKSYIIFFINAIIASLLLYNLCKKIKDNRVVVLLSTGTLVILGLHDSILQILSKIDELLHISNNSLVSSIIVIFILKSH